MKVHEPLMTSILTFDFAPYRCSGVIYGTLMNDPQSLLALGDAVHQAPYKAPPKAPVLYMKPRNTLAVSGSNLVCPAGSTCLKIGATLGIVIGRTACRVKAEHALDFIAGYTIANDVSLPLESCYRPSIRFIARDGFCPLGPKVVPASSIPDPDALAVRVFVDNVMVQNGSTAARVRPVARLLSDITEFMTLQAGDILLLGEAAHPPLARPGQHVAIEIDGLGRLENMVVGEEAVA
jgi:5-oxopent-3-ene-1,2,5-tricarboxylate decarboxylase / 2-hydroxyhepta-2,4-diene-1,7-dioate isomerase